jgi:hypothetical protein
MSVTRSVLLSNVFQAVGIPSTCSTADQELSVGTPVTSKSVLSEIKKKFNYGSKLRIEFKTHLDTNNNFRQCSNMKYTTLSKRIGRAF